MVTLRRDLRTRSFTLVELIVAMGILSILMLLLVQFVIVTQRAWSLSQQRTRVYENSRAIFEVIERDFQTMAVSNVAGRIVEFYIGDPIPADSSQSLHCCVVSSQDPHADANSRFVEISYKHHNDASDPANMFTLRRQMVSQNDSANWDCVNSSGTWYLNENLSSNRAEFEVLSRGVDSFSMTFFDDTNQTMTAGTSHRKRPNRIVVNVTLFDESLQDLSPSERFKTQRSFSKVFHLPTLLHEE
ncbi:MAG: type II secretory pathway pseudopilin PulG [Rhodothermales bacterium]|jgi:type II secretory pathway pseudopilin PulG